MNIPSKIKTALFIFLFCIISPVFIFSFEGILPNDADVPVYYKDNNVLIFNLHDNIVNKSKEGIFELFFVDPKTDKFELVYSARTNGKRLQLLNPQSILKKSGTYCYSVNLSETSNFIDGQKPVKIYFNYWPECNEIDQPKLDQINPDYISISWKDFHRNEAYSYIIRYRFWADENIEPNWQQVEVFETNYNLPLISSMLYVDIQIKRICRYQNGIQISSNWTDIGQVNIQLNDRGFSCTRLSGFTVDSITKSSMKVIMTTDLDANLLNGPWYTVKYKEAALASWNTVYILSGKSITITGLKPNTLYNVKANMTFGGSDYRNPLTTCSDLTTQNITTLDWVDWSKYVCKDTTFTYTPTGSGNKDSLKINDVILINLFPLKISSISYGGSGYFSGEGVIPVPFGKKKIQVEFTNIHVNTSNIVDNGKVTIKTDTDKYNDFQAKKTTLPPAEFNCQPPIEDSTYLNNDQGWNQFGFDSTGHYVRRPPFKDYIPGMLYDSLYDPYGFDSTGINLLTGTKYDLYGCNQMGLDSTGSPCNHGGVIPYHWMYPKNTNEKAISYYNSKRDSIKIYVWNALLALISRNQDSLTNKRNLCGEYKTQLLGIADDKDLDPIFLFGQDSLYLKEGMSKEFASPPIEFTGDIDRDNDIKLMEKVHIQLYKCDYSLDAYKKMSSLLILAQGDTSTLIKYIKDIIVTLDSFKIDTLGQGDNLYKFIFKNIDTEMLNRYLNEYHSGYGLLNKKEKSYEINKKSYCQKVPIEKEKFSINTIGCSAISDIKDQLFKKFSDFKSDNYYSNYYKYKEIEEHAFLLEKIINDKKQRSAFLTGNDDGIYGPIEISKEILSVSYSIYFDNIEIGTNYAKADVYFILETDSGKKIVFSATDVGFSTYGTPHIGKLSLIGKQSFSVGKGMRIIINGGQDSTFVTFDCNGLAQIALDADVEFCREYIVPINETTREPLPDPATVKANFKVVMTGWSEFIAKINVPAFAINGHTDYSFKIQDAWLDFSESANPVPMTYPEGYPANLQTITWKGVYFKNLTVTMPDFMKKNSETKSEISITNFVFDNEGVSGQIAAKPLLSLAEGSINGWAFSIDSINIVIIKNFFRKGSMNGLLNVPLMRKKNTTSSTIEKEDCFSYKATVDSYGNFMFDVGIGGDFGIPLLFADLTLKTGTSVMIQKFGDKYEASANLTGVIRIDNKSIGGQNFNVDSISFQDVKLSTNAPYVKSIGIWSFPNVQMDFGGFELNINNIYLSGSENNIKLNFVTEAKVSASALDLSLSMGFSISGVRNTSGIHHKWVYDDLNVTGASLGGGVQGVFSVKGELNFFKNNSTYGSGFYGGVSLNFDKFQVKVTAVGTFGKIAQNNSSYKYCMIDVMASAGEGIPLIPPLNVDGMGGGFWFNMQEPDVSHVQLSATPPDPTTLGAGQSLTGVHYVPASGAWGFKVAMSFNVVAPNTMNGNASFRMNFNSSGGLDIIAIEGNVRLMADQDIDGAATFQTTGDPNNGAPLSAYIQIKYDFTNSALSADFDAYLNFGSVIHGAGTGGLFVKASLLFSPGDWHIWFGTPESPAGVTMNLGIFNAGLSTYFDIGNSLPKPAQLNALLAKFFGVPADFAQAGMVKSGGGFMHGLSFNVGINKKFWIFTLEASLNLGYDLAVLNYGNTVCSNLQNQTVGINGWYGSGQIYLYLSASVGYDADLWLFHLTGTIASVQAGVLLRAQLPNPFWATGKFKLKYNLLGLLKGSYEFQLELGTRCNMVNPDGGNVSAPKLQVINSIEPYDQTDQVPTDQKLKVSFNYKMNETLYLQSLDGSQMDAYTFLLTDVILSENHFGNIWVNQSWNNDHTELYFADNQFLNSNSTYFIDVRVKIYKNGILYGSERDTALIHTLRRPSIIPDGNVAESIPHVDQKNFFLHEYDIEHGYIKLNLGQNYLLQVVPPNAINVIRIVDNENNKLYESEIIYDCYQNIINYKIDWANILEPGTEYKLMVVQTFKPKEENGGGQNNGDNLVGKNNTRTLGGQGGTGNNFPPPPPGPKFYDCGRFVDNEADSIKSESVLFTIPFRTSLYETMEDKLNYTFSSGKTISTSNGAKIYKYRLSNAEGFDQYEIYGFNGCAPFLKFKFLEKECNWTADYRKFYVKKPYGILAGKGYLHSNTNTQTMDDVFQQCFFITNGIDSSFQDETHNENQPSILLKMALPEIIDRDLNTFWQQLSTYIAMCQSESAKNPDHPQVQDQDCIDDYCVNDAFLTKIYNKGAFTIKGPFVFEIKYNDKAKTNKGVGTYKFTLNLN